MFYIFGTLSLISRFISQLSFSIGDKNSNNNNLVTFGYADQFSFLAVYSKLVMGFFQAISII
jgi:hypothetical protein